MNKFFITESIKEEKGKAIDLMAEVHKKLMTPDVAAALAAGCHFDIAVGRQGENIIMRMTSREKVSILKTQDGVPVNVIVQP